MPVRQTNGYYLVTDSDLINEIVACADANSSIVYNTMKSVKGYVLGEDSFKFVVDWDMYLYMSLIIQALFILLR